MMNEMNDGAEDEKMESEDTGYSMNNLIAIPDALKDRLDDSGTLEVDYELTEQGGIKCIKVTGVEGQPVASEPETPESRLKKRVGYGAGMDKGMMM